MAIHQRRSRLFVTTICLFALAGFGRSEAQENDWKETVVALEKEVFDSVLTADEVDRLLGELKLPDKRATATRQLCEQGRGHIERILVFAHDCPDIEARQACADVVEALDSAYRTTDRGRQLGSLYREHAEELLPDYWARFRKNPLDHRAVAMLMSADPDNIYKLLGKIGDRHDKARFYLLRIRELSPDKFAAEHIDDHTATGILLVLSDVFPCANHQWNQQVFFGAHRTVGHAYLNVVHICPSEPLHPVSGQPTIIRRGKQDNNCILPSVRGIEIHRRLVGLFVNNAGKVYCLSLDSRGYQSKKLQGRQFWGGSRLRFLETDEGLCQLPKLDIKSTNKIPWYVEPYVPAAYRSKMRFKKPTPGEIPPAATAARHADSSALLGRRTVRPAAPMDSSVPTVVIPPPRLPDAADRMSRAEADLACDRLGEEIAAEGIARVLDRGQLDRVLEEKKIGNDFSKPILAYDAIIRVEVDVPSLVPEARMTLIDLSHGNVMAELRCDWPMREDDLSRMVEKCREGLKRVRQPKDGKLKVRCLRAKNEEKNPRLRSLTNRLELVFQESVARSPRLVPIHHLEASGAKEESLLLLMGLSRPPGGRQFSPQADATIELSVREGDGRGKTFEQTPVEITARVIRGDASGDQSFSIATTVAEFDSAAAKTWEKLSGLLREARPDAATGWLDDLAARRRQAEAELRAAKAIELRQFGTSQHEQAVRDMLSHTEAAVKLDPTFEDALGKYLRAMAMACSSARSKKEPEKIMEIAESILNCSLRYFDRFGTQGKYRQEAHDTCSQAIGTALGQLDNWGSVELTSRQLKLIELAKLVLEDAVKYDGQTTVPIHRNASTTIYSRSAVLTIVGRAMKQNGVPLAEREKWIDGILEQCAKSEATLPEIKDRDPRVRIFREMENDIFKLDRDELMLRAAELAVEDIRLNRARQLAVQLQDRIKKARVSFTPVSRTQNIIPRLRVIVLRMDDADRLAEFDRWTWGDGKIPVIAMQIRWPSADVFQDRKNVSQGRYFSIAPPPVDGAVIRREPMPDEGGLRAIHPLVKGDGCLYLAINYSLHRKSGRNKLSTSSQKVGYIPLDEMGRPVGKTHQVPKYPHEDLWDSLAILPEPPVDEQLSILDAKYVADRLYLGTTKNGLMEYDPQSKKWRVFGPEQEMPTDGVARIFPLDERTLFCVGALSYRRPVCFTLDLPKGKVTLLNRVQESLDDPGPKYIFRDGKKLSAWGKEGIYDDLLSPKIQFTRYDWESPYGWNATIGNLGILSRDGRHGVRNMVEADGRRFIARGGLHEINANGKIIRSWWRRSTFTCKSNVTMHLPASSPVNSDNMAVMGDKLVFSKEGMPRITFVVWDPKTDMWYGPLGVRSDAPHNCDHFLGTSAGVWQSTTDGMVFVSAEDLLNTAKKEGRVMTTAEYQRRQREIISIMPPLDQAKMAISMREFDNAEKILNQVLVSDANCAEAFLLLGQANDWYCANRPEKALEYYQRLADLKSNPKASFTGLFRRLSLLEHLKRWPEALEAVEEINHAFAGRLDPFAQRRLEESWKRIVEKLSEQNVKHPAAETSNKEERQTQ